MTIVLTKDNYFQISGDAIFMLMRLKEATEKEDIFSIMLISGQLSQYMSTYSLTEMYNEDLAYGDGEKEK